ncbi:DEAD/DEAH box helicase [Pseudonocardia spirodelae]|uniref:Helicase-related protein n=1 Tax=Pseudonocardia spirodelae TaxID=3133431 RepID=A0ABU8T0H3_9PSEU
MEQFVRSGGDVARTFGYHPRTTDLTALLHVSPFTRLVVVGGGVSDVTASVPQIRTAPTVELPNGVYWFSGIESPLTMVVDGGLATEDGSAIAVDDLTQDAPLMSAYEWAEHLWDEGHAVPRPRFGIGESVVTRSDGKDSEIKSRRFVAGVWRYEVRLDGRSQRFTESALESAPEFGGPAEWVRSAPAAIDRFGATLTRGKLAATLTDTVFSFRATRTVFRPYQFKPVLRLLHTGATRILIADEVGLGKTIEAGLIWTELEARRAADRVLIISPSSLVGKWQHEMEERFTFELEELDTKGLARFLEQHRQDRLPKRFRYITSLERLRKWGGLEEFDDAPPQLDLIVVDEAHQMRNPGTKSHELGVRLNDWADARVFLTATPVNLGYHDLASMLELLAPEDFDDPHVLALRLEPNAVLHRIESLLLNRTANGAERLAVLDDLKNMTFGPALMSRPDYKVLRELVGQDILDPAQVVEARRILADLNALSSAVTRTRKAEIDDAKALRDPHTERVVWTDAERDFYSEYLNWCRRRAEVVNMPLHFAMQMPLRLASACLPAARAAVLGHTEQWAPQDEDDPSSASAASTVPPHSDLLAAANALPSGVDSKFDVLLPILEDLIRQGKQTLLFTFSRPTLTYLRNRLSGDARVAVLHGGVPREERRRVMTQFRKGEFDVVLANRVASEGLDFEFCSTVINYDLPWNPMEVEQRIGRIDRIGQHEQKIRIVNFYNEDTIDEKILTRVLERIGVFTRAIGALEPIIQSELSSLREAVYSFDLDVAQREAKADQVMTAIAAKKAEAERLAGAAADLLVSNDVDVTGLERELVRAGRYVGQKELAHLLHDWANTAGAPGLTRADDLHVTLRGNAAMGDQLQDVARRGDRLQTEIVELARALRDEAVLPLALDQEDARTTGGALLTATHPLVLAAVSVPGHRQARFAHVRVHDPDGVAEPGRYAVVLARVEGDGERAVRELWGAAVDLNGREAPTAVPHALLAALARGELREADDPADAPQLVGPISRAADLLDERQWDEEQRRSAEGDALADSRRLSLEEQLRRKESVIERRMQTARANGRGALHLFEGQRRRARERHREALRLLDDAKSTELRMEHIAVCYLEVAR